MGSYEYFHRNYSDWITFMEPRLYDFKRVSCVVIEINSEWEIGDESSNSSRDDGIHLHVNTLVKLWIYHFSIWFEKKQIMVTITLVCNQSTMERNGNRLGENLQPSHSCIATSESKLIERDMIAQTVSHVQLVGHCKKKTW